MSYPPQQQPQQPYSPRPPFASAHTRAQLAKALLLANAAVAAVSLVFQFLTLGGVGGGVVDPETLEEVNYVELLHGLVGLAQVAVYITTVVLFLMWLHRSYKNLHAFGVQTEQSPGWAVGNWFIPFLNLVRPYQNVKETWIKSDPGVDFSGGYADGGPAARATTLVGVWWGFWILSNFADRIYGRLVWDAETGDQLNAAAAIGVFTDLLNIIAAVLAFLVVNTIDRMQEEKAARLTLSAWPAPPPPPASFETPAAQA